MTELISVPLSLDPCHSQCVAGLSTCQFTSSGYACQCVDGYHRESSTTDSACVGNCFCFLVFLFWCLTCYHVDVNECAGGPCSTAATCINTVGSFQCVCNLGYTGDGLNCYSQ